MGVLKTTRFARVMLPVDFSPQTDAAARDAAWFAQLGDGTVHLVHVIPDPLDSLYTPEEVSNWDLVQHAERKAKELLEATAQRCLPPGCKWEAHTFIGNPYERLAGAADALRIDLIVMASHGRGGVAQLMIGSVAERIVRHSKVPVFVVPKRTDADSEG